MIEPETFTFLTDLALNNRKAWVDEHREERDDAMRNFAGVAQSLHDYSDRFDTLVADTKSKPKQSYTKFFQDARQRSGPGLYRTEIDIFANAGHPEEDFGYYLHIAPGKCYAGAGLLQPSKEGLARTRARLNEDPEGLKDALEDEDFRAMFPTVLLTDKELNVVPEGYDNSDPAAPFLKMVGWRCQTAIADEDLLDDDVIYTLIDIFRAAAPLVRHFN